LGDRSAYAALYERTSPHLFAVVLRINRDAAVCSTHRGLGRQPGGARWFADRCAPTGAILYLGKLVF